MATRPPLTRPVRTTLVLAAVIAAFGALQAITAVFERSYLDGNADRLVAEADDPVGMAAYIGNLDELLGLTMLAGLICAIGGAIGLALRQGRSWARLTMMVTLVAGTLLYLSLMAVGNIEFLSGHLWIGPAEPPDSLMLLRWYPPVYYLTSMTVVAASITAGVMLFREPLKDFVYAHRPQTGSDWDLGAVKERQARRTQ